MQIKCAECGVEFEHNAQGKPKFCPTCRPRKPQPKAPKELDYKVLALKAHDLKLRIDRCLAIIADAMPKEPIEPTEPTEQIEATRDPIAES